MVTGSACIGWSIGNVEENVFGLKAGNGDALEVVLEGEAKSPKSSSSRKELGCEADWAGGAKRLRPDPRLREGGSCRD